MKHLEDYKEHRSTSKILGVTWDKEADLLLVDFNSCLSLDAPLIKRKMLGVLNSVFDILGWVSPVIIAAKSCSANFA